MMIQIGECDDNQCMRKNCDADAFVVGLDDADVDLAVYVCCDDDFGKLLNSIKRIFMFLGQSL